MCNELIVTLRLERSHEVASQADLLGHLDSMRVASALAFCPYERQASEEYLAARGVGEKGLAERVRALDLVGSAKTAYDKLLVEGSYCGFDRGGGTQTAESTPKLFCTMTPSKIKFCFESKLVMDVNWPAESRASNQLLDGLKLAEVMAVRFSCEVPAIKSGGSQL